jgi:nucleotide-binding universal stress UspA family protein
MSPVVVPLDGSRRAETALPYARYVARGETLILVTTMWERDGVRPREYLERQASALVPDEVEVVVIRDRGAADAILLTAAERPGSMICMASHGRTGLGEAVLGSVAEAVVREAHHPVLLVGPNAAAEPSRTGPVLLAVDTPATARAITPAAAAFAAALSVGIAVVEVVAPPPIPFSAELEGPGNGVSAMTARAVITEGDQVAECTILRQVDPVRALLGFATERQASFVVVGTHAREGLARAVLGSVAMRVVHGAHCPVLVVRS